MVNSLNESESKHYEEKVCSSCGHNEICSDHFPGGCSMYFKSAGEHLKARGKVANEMPKCPEPEDDYSNDFLMRYATMIHPHKGY